MLDTKDDRFYDKIYKQGGCNKEYFKTAEDSIYYTVWKTVLGYLDKEDKILELGCGVGQLAKLITDKGFNYIAGIDFSIEGLRLAKQKAQELVFILLDLYDERWVEFDFNVVILSEVLEHLKNDLMVLSYIPKGCKVIFAVPNYDSEGHVRYFRTVRDVLLRYKNLIDVNSSKIITINKKTRKVIMVFKGEKIT